MVKKLKTFILAVSLIITFILTNSLNAVESSEEGTPLVRMKNQMRIASMDEKRISKEKDSKAKKKKSKTKKKKSKAKKKKSKAKKRSRAKKKPKAKKKKFRSKKKKISNKKALEVKKTKKVKKNRKLLAAANRSLKRLRSKLFDIYHSNDDLMTPAERRQKEGKLYPRMKAAFKQKLNAEAALAGKSINAEKEFHKILRPLAKVGKNYKKTTKMRQGYDLAITVIYDDTWAYDGNDDVIKEAREKLINDYSDLLNGDVDNYVNKVACSIIYASRHGIKAIF